jgi:hypothetical protein
MLAKKSWEDKMLVGGALPLAFPPADSLQRNGHVQSGMTFPGVSRNNAQVGQEHDASNHETREIECAEMECGTREREGASAFSVDKLGARFAVAEQAKEEQQEIEIMV